MSYKRGFEKVPYPLGTEKWKSFLNYARSGKVSHNKR
jgi:hypothetical protein